MPLWDFFIIYVGLGVVAFYAIRFVWSLTIGMVFGEIFGPFGKLTEWRIDRKAAKYEAQGMSHHGAYMRAMDNVYRHKDYPINQYD